LGCSVFFRPRLVTFALVHIVVPLLYTISSEEELIVMSEEPTEREYDLPTDDIPRCPVHGMPLQIKGEGKFMCPIDGEVFNRYELEQTPTCPKGYEPIVDKKIYKYPPDKSVIDKYLCKEHGMDFNADDLAEHVRASHSQKEQITVFKHLIKREIEKKSLGRPILNEYLNTQVSKELDARMRREWLSKEHSTTSGEIDSYLKNEVERLANGVIRFIKDDTSGSDAICPLCNKCGPYTYDEQFLTKLQPATSKENVSKGQKINLNISGVKTLANLEKFLHLRTVHSGTYDKLRTLGIFDLTGDTVNLSASAKKENIRDAILTYFRTKQTSGERRKD